MSIAERVTKIVHDKAEFFGVSHLETLLDKVLETSIELMVLVVELEREFGIRFHLSEIVAENFRNPEILFAFLERKMREK